MDFFQAWQQIDWFPLRLSLQVAAVLRSSANKDAARAFAAYLSGPESRRILETYGFERP